MISREDAMIILKCVGDETISNLPTILEPFSKYGKAIGICVKAMRDGLSKAEEIRKLKTEVVKEIKAETAALKPPKYMDCVIFTPKQGYLLTEDQMNILKAVLLQEYDSDDERSLTIAGEFIRQYMGGEINVDSTEECEIRNAYVSFNFFGEYKEDEHSYDEEDMQLVMEAFNAFLAEEVFDYFLVTGHEESWID